MEGGTLIAAIQGCVIGCRIEPFFNFDKNQEVHEFLMCFASFVLIGVSLSGLSGCQQIATGLMKSIFMMRFFQIMKIIEVFPVNLRNSRLLHGMCSCWELLWMGRKKSWSSEILIISVPQLRSWDIFVFNSVREKKNSCPLSCGLIKPAACSASNVGAG